jgi:hypothetical protein
MTSEMLIGITKGGKDALDAHANSGSLSMIMLNIY